MNKVSNLLISKDTIFLYIFFYFLFYFIISPDLSQILSIILLDSFLLVAIFFWHEKLTLNFYPKFKKVYEPSLEQNLSEADEKIKKKVLNLSIKYPAASSTLLTILLLIKASLVGAIGIYLMLGEEDFVAKSTLLLAAVLAWVLGQYKFAYYQKICFWGQKICSWHENYGLTEALYGVTSVQRKNYFLNLFKGLPILGVLAALGLFYNSQLQSFSSHGVLLVIGVVIFIAFIYHRLHKGQEEVLDTALASFHRQLQRSIAQRRLVPVAPYPGTKPLALSVAINQSIARLNSEQEDFESKLEDQIFQYRAIMMKELSTGVIHDLYTPLQNLKLCCEILRRDPEYAKKQDFLNDIACSVEQTTDIATSIRNYLRSSKMDDKRTFQEIFDNILIMLRPKYPGLDLKEVFKIESALLEQTVRISATSAIHVLFNLLDSILGHLIEVERDNPVICVSRAREKDKGIIIQDNKEGVGVARFYQKLSQLDSGQNYQRDSSALWLTSRMISRMGGDIKLIDSSSSGTLLKWKLASMENMANEY